MKQHRIEFPGTSFTPLQLADRTSLALHLSVQNSPLLFGCRSGLCGTCLIEVESDEPLPAPDRSETETLEIYAPGNPRARLACQLLVSSNLRIRRLESA